MSGYSHESSLNWRFLIAAFILCSASLITAFSCESGGNEDDSFETRRDSAFASREAEIQRFARRSGDFISVRYWEGVSTLAYQQLVDSGRAILFEGLMHDIFRREDSTVALVIALLSVDSALVISENLTGDILECSPPESLTYTTTVGSRVVVLVKVDSVEPFTYAEGLDSPVLRTVRRFAGRCIDLMDASIDFDMLLGFLKTRNQP